MIPFCIPEIGRAEERAVRKVLRSKMLTQGTWVKVFEELFAEYVGAKYAVATGSCTQALHLCLEHMGVRQKDVAVPSLTFTASAAAIVHAGGRPKFVDVDPESYCIRGNVLEKEPAVLVNLTGNEAPDYGETNKVFDSAHLIERGCHRGKYQCYSFHGTKNMTTGFGGMITTNDEEFYRWAQIARNHGCYKAEWKEGMLDEVPRWGYSVEFPGWKYNMTNIQAAIGIEQLKKLDKMNQERRRCVMLYNYAFNMSNTGLHLYPIFVEDRNEFLAFMRKEGIECSVHFEPLHKMKAYEKYPPVEGMKITEWIGDHIVSLPLYPSLKNKQIDYIVDRVLKSQKLINRVPYV